jgi:hypothetical protein
MAEWQENVEERLARLEEAMVNIAGILVDQSARIDYGFRAGREETQALRREFSLEMRELRTSLTERLDRLIAATLRDRTQTADRLANIEERLTKLEERERH